MNTYRNILIAASILFLFTNCNSQSLKNNDNVELLEQEFKNQENAKNGTIDFDIEIIDDLLRVNKIQSEIIQKTIAEEKKNSETKKNKSLGELYKSGDKSVVQELVKILNGNNVKLKKETLNSLEKNYDEDFTISEKNLIDAILSNVNIDNCEKDAIQLAGISKLNGFVPVFEKRLLSGNSKDIGRLFYWLGEDGKSEASIDYIIQQIQSRKINNDEFQNFIMTGFEGFSENGSPSSKKKVYEFCINAYNKKLIPKKYFDELSEYSYSSGNPAESILKCIFKNADINAKPIILEQINKKIRLNQALTALVKIDGINAKKIVVSYLSSKEYYSDAVSATANLYNINKDESVLKEFFKQSENNNENQDDIASFVNSLKSFNIDDLSSKAKLYINNKKILKEVLDEYALSKLTNESIAEDLFTIGILEERISKEQLNEPFENEEDNKGLFYVLEKAGILIYYDAEVSEIPVNYTALINDYKNHSNHKLDSLYVWMDYSEKQDYTYEYKITLVFNNKVYIVKPKDIGDWYDAGMITQLLNKILKDSNIQERFNIIESRDQMVQLVFAKPENFAIMTTKYKL